MEEFLAVRDIQFSQESGGKILTINMVAQRH